MSSVDRLAQTIAALKQRVTTLETAPPQLPHSSVIINGQDVAVPDALAGAVGAKAAVAELNDTVLPALDARLLENAEAVAAAQAILDASPTVKLAMSELVAQIATIIELDAGRIVSGTVDTGRLNAEAVAAAVGSFLKITAENLAAGSVTAEAFASTLVLASTIIAGDPAGAHVELGANGLVIKDAAGNVVLQQNASGGIEMAGNLRRTDGKAFIEVGKVPAFGSTSSNSGLSGIRFIPDHGTANPSEEGGESLDLFGAWITFDSDEAAPSLNLELHEGLISPKTAHLKLGGAETRLAGGTVDGGGSNSISLGSTMLFVSGAKSMELNQSGFFVGGSKVGPPQYIHSSSWQNLSASSASRVLADIPIPAADHDRWLELSATLSYSAQTISSGAAYADICMSFNATQVANTDVKYRVSRNQYTNFSESATLHAMGYLVPAGVAVVPRLWHYNSNASPITWGYAAGRFTAKLIPA